VGHRHRISGETIRRIVHALHDLAETSAEFEADIQDLLLGLNHTALAVTL
jgi:hypothetical protein